MNFQKSREHKEFAVVSRTTANGLAKGPVSGPAIDQAPLLGHRRPTLDRVE